jgi:hypothetical protein
MAPPFLTSALDGSEWPASRPGHFILGEIAHIILWIRGWVGPRIDLDDVKQRETSSLCRESNTGIPVRSLAMPNELSRFPLSLYNQMKVL